MTYRLGARDEKVESGVRRVAVDRIDEAIAAIDDSSVPRDVAVHTVRKRCKELRALVRLVGPAFAQSGRENAAFRDIARALAGDRDRAVMEGTFGRLVEDHGELLEPATVAAVRAALADGGGAGGEGQEGALAEARAGLAEARLRALNWSLDETGWRAVSGGLERTYRKARRKMRRALASEDGETLHEWRKDAKYHMNHLRLMRPLWPDVMKPAAKAADRLGEDLGQHHDLEVLAAWLEQEAHRLGGAEAVAPLVSLCRREQAHLAGDARACAERLFAERPRAFSRRMKAYWSARRRQARATAPAEAPAATPGELLPA